MLHGFSVPLTPQGKSALASPPPWHYSSDCLSLVQTATGAPDEEIVLGIQEIPSSQAMEMGQIMPDVASS